RFMADEEAAARSKAALLQDLISGLRPTMEEHMKVQTKALARNVSSLVAMITALFGMTLLMATFGARAQSWDDVVKAAEAEGKLTIAGPPIQPYRLSIMEFQKAFPKIQLEYTGIADADFEAKLKTERSAGLYLWDLRVAGVSTTVFTEQIPAGWFDPIRPLFMRPDVLDDSKWLGGFEAGFLDNAKKYAYAFQAGLGGNVYIDRAQLPESKVSSFKDFLDPSLKGKIAMIDPRARGGTSALTLIMVVAGEQAACDLLGKQEPVLTRTPRQLVEWAMTGRYPITTGMSPSEWMEWKSKGFGKQVQLINLPPHQRNWTPGWGAMLLINKAPHPN